MDYYRWEVAEAVLDISPIYHLSTFLQNYSD